MSGASQAKASSYKESHDSRKAFWFFGAQMPFTSSQRAMIDRHSQAYYDLRSIHAQTLEDWLRERFLPAYFHAFDIDGRRRRRRAARAVVRLFEDNTSSIGRLRRIRARPLRPRGARYDISREESRRIGIWLNHLVNDPLFHFPRRQLRCLITWDFTYIYWADGWGHGNEGFHYWVLTSVLPFIRGTTLFLSPPGPNIPPHMIANRPDEDWDMPGLIIPSDDNPWPPASWLDFHRDDGWGPLAWAQSEDDVDLNQSL
ncbi:hypothetical protein BDZ89DRAFT_1055076 [Hymenopellis radicata]|nr:hypothetical protein BDZ89DRAFT_1055076 [Hymenopellis radicata]